MEYSAENSAATGRRYTADGLVSFATALLGASGLDADKADTVAEILVEGDLLGYPLHGLQLLGPYLDQLDRGLMARTGEPEVVADRGGCLTWDGHRLPGQWLVARALGEAIERIPRHGVVTVVIRRSHHIGCLAAYLRRATGRGLAVLLMSSEPSGATVAPHGGARPVLATNPIAAGWPTDGDPVLVDFSTSITTAGLARRRRDSDEKFQGPWAQDNVGNPTDNPGAPFAEPPGALLPIGGVDHGHKGFGLGLTVEMLTSALAGHGRAEPPEGWAASVFLQVIDPDAFGGINAFTRETGWLADACRNAPVTPWFEALGSKAVHLPGAARPSARRGTGDTPVHHARTGEARHWAGCSRSRAFGLRAGERSTPGPVQASSERKSSYLPLAAREISST